MPQASSAQHREWNGPAEDTACLFLEGLGYRLTAEWFWVPPSPGHVVTPKERSAIEFLIDEWDYGGVIRV
jgi:hypothetical protein